MDWWVGQLMQSEEYVKLVSWVVWVLASITLHELAHGWVAVWEGDDTPIRLGHLTANPLVHMGGLSLLMFALCGIAWGAMPVNPSRFRHGRLGDLLVAAAGPAMNVALALVSVISLTLWTAFGPTGTDLHENVVTFFFWGALLNVVLALFNLMPIPPLDGSRILGALSSRAAQLYTHPQAALIGTFLFVAIVFMTPGGAYLFGFAGWLTVSAWDLGVDALAAGGRSG